MKAHAAVRDLGFDLRNGYQDVPATHERGRYLAGGAPLAPEFLARLGGSFRDCSYT